MKYISTQNILTEGVPFHPDDYDYGQEPTDEWYVKQAAGYLKAHDLLKKGQVYFTRNNLTDKIWAVKEQL